MRISLKNKTVLISAGPTREPIDAVRYISNRSSGKMGYALAKEAKRMGAKVILVSGPVALPEPAGIKIIKVETTSEMLNAISGNIKYADLLIMAAAPADFTPRRKIAGKIKRSGGICIKLKPTPDILKAMSGKKGLKKNMIKAGFAAETGLFLSRACKKLKDKKLDVIIANDISRKDTGFDSDYNEVYIIKRDKTVIKTGKLRKKLLAKKILLSLLDR